MEVKEMAPAFIEMAESGACGKDGPAFVHGSDISIPPHDAHISEGRGHRVGPHQPPTIDPFERAPRPGRRRDPPWQWS